LNRPGRSATPGGSNELPNDEVAENLTVIRLDEIKPAWQQNTKSYCPGIPFKKAVDAGLGI
jgi:hypothetical protein